MLCGCWGSQEIGIWRHGERIYLDEHGGFVRSIGNRIHEGDCNWEWY
jgi:hypothetical protein